MTRSALWIALVSVAFFSIVMIAFRLQPPNTTPEAEIGRCSTLCWQGIEPGITTKQVALTNLTAAHGFQPLSPECFSPSIQPCELFEWHATDDANVSTGIQTQRGVVISVEAKTPAFTLGEALLSLDRLHQTLYSFQLGHNLNWFFIWLSFSDSSISVSAQSSCPNSFLALLQTPVDTLAIQSPNPFRQHDPMTFGLLRSMFYHLCEK